MLLEFVLKYFLIYCFYTFIDTIYDNLITNFEVRKAIEKEQMLSLMNILFLKFYTI